VVYLGVQTSGAGGMFRAGRVNDQAEPELTRCSTFAAVILIGTSAVWLNWESGCILEYSLLRCESDQRIVTLPKMQDVMI